jgi:hypothetical protein
MMENGGAGRAVSTSKQRLICIANRSAIKREGRHRELKLIQQLRFFESGSGPGGRWFKSTRPDHFFIPLFFPHKRPACF